MSRKNENKSSDPFVIKTGRFASAKAKPIYRSGWTEDSYISHPKNNQEVIGQSFNSQRLPMIAAFFSFLLLLLLGRTAWLQIAKRDYYYQLAEGNRIRIDRVEPQRGIIYDRQGNALVRNQANFMLYFVPADLPIGEDLDKLISDIEGIIGNISVEEIKGKLATIKKTSLEAYQPLFIKDNIEYEKAMKLYLKAADWPGVVLFNKSGREYLLTENSTSKNLLGKNDSTGEYSLSLSHVLGYTGKINETELKQYGNEYLPIDYIGKMGVEYFWENELKGSNGKKQIEVDALGKEKKVISETQAVPGNNLVLTIDVNQQIKLEELLRQELDKLHLPKGVAIVMDPNNGEILALVSLPTFNNNLFTRDLTQSEYDILANDPNQPLYNRAVSGEYPSGSTIKPIMAAAALEEGIINEHTTVLSTGGIQVGQWFFPDWKAGGHGLTDVRKALAWSINTFFYYIGGGYQNFSGLGIDRIVHYAQMFGLGAQTGIDLAGEASGFLPTPEWKENVKKEKWYIGDTYHVSIGQGDLLVTPLQVSSYMSVFANGGTLYRPHLVKSITTGDTKESREIKNEPVKADIIKAGNINIVREGLRQTVTAGSAQSLQAVPVPVAGKTGTAQWSTKEKTHAWFAGFAPYNQPEIVITILIEAGGEGSSVCVPIARDFLTWYFGSYKASNSNNQTPRDK
ncbi:MAG: penicillin-binding protein 2 [Candidatus Falkowbacteria bacterium]|nr:penicillin-binding protein 2 [Candidatus Falkowbacteria bacterium]